MTDNGEVLRKIRRALISVSDKRGVVDFARELKGFGVEIISTGGTARALRDAGIDVRDVSDVTGFPEMMDGRVKTLHPRIHGALLGLRDKPEHVAAMQAHGIEPIDMIVINLYPFEETVSGGATLDEAIEQIDIGGPAMIRSAAKNYRDVAVIVSRGDFAGVIAEMKRLDGALDLNTRLELAQRAFEWKQHSDGGSGGQPRNDTQKEECVAIRRESTPAGGALRSRLAGRHSQRRPSLRQGDVLQQLC